MSATETAAKAEGSLITPFLPSDDMSKLEALAVQRGQPTEVLVEAAIQELLDRQDALIPILWSGFISVDVLNRLRRLGQELHFGQAELIRAAIARYVRKQQ